MHKMRQAAVSILLTGAAVLVGVASSTPAIAATQASTSVQVQNAQVSDSSVQKMAQAGDIVWA